MRDDVRIAYWSKYGYTHKAAVRLADYLGASDPENLRGVDCTGNCSWIIFCLPIYLFKFPPEFRRLANAHKEWLLSRKIGFFISSTMQEKILRHWWGIKWINHFVDGLFMPSVGFAIRSGGRRMYESLSAFDRNVLAIGKTQYGDSIDIEDFDDWDNSSLERVKLALEGS